MTVSSSLILSYTSQDPSISIDGDRRGIRTKREQVRKGCSRNSNKKFEQEIRSRNFDRKIGSNYSATSCKVMCNVQYCAMWCCATRYCGSCARSCNIMQLCASFRRITQLYPIACDIGQHRATLSNIVQCRTRK